MFELKTDGIARRDQNELASPLQSGPILQSYPPRPPSFCPARPDFGSILREFLSYSVGSIRFEGKSKNSGKSEGIADFRC